MMRIAGVSFSGLLSISLSAAALAASSPATEPAMKPGPISRVGEALSIEVARPQLIATLKDGFHFNLKAPNHLSGFPSGPIKPKAAGEHKIEVELPGSATFPAGSALVLYVCDDANTFCDIERRDLSQLLTIAGGEVHRASPEVKRGKEPELTETPDAHGFYHHDFASVLKRAKREKKLVLVEFAARWCPGCQRLASEVLDRKTVSDELKNFVKYYADIDLFENFDLAKKYSAQGVPTMLFLDSNGDEISRLVDYRPAEVVKELIKAVRAKPVTLTNFREELVSTGVKAKGEELLLLGRRLLAANRSDEAIAFLERVRPAPPELFQLRVERAAKLQKDQPSEVHRVALKTELAAALKQDKGTLVALAWRAQLAALLERSSDERKELIAIARKQAAGWLEKPEMLKAALTPESVGEYHGLEKFLVAVSWAEFLEGLGDQEREVGEAWRKAAETGKASGITVEQDGPGLRYLIVLVAAGKFDDADRWVRKLIARQPENKDLLRRRARILNGLKQYDEAAKIGEEIRKSSEGRIEFLVVEQLAKSYIGMGKPEKAKSVLDETLARPELQKIEKLQDQRKKLTDLRRGLI